jgi:hypothetical protein
MDQKIKLFKIHTLVDITKSNVTSGGGQQRDQQRNWDTLLQVLSLRTQIHNIDGPHLLSGVHPSKFKLGHNHRGEHNVWEMGFVLEFDYVFGPPENPFEILASDFENVPIITGLTETIKIVPPVFKTDTWDKNIAFSKL